MTDEVRGLLAAIREHLDVPHPADEADRLSFERLQHSRVITVLGVIDALLDHGHPPQVLETIVRRETQPVTYRPYVAGSCGEGCVSPGPGVHDHCPGPRAGAEVVDAR